MASLRFIALSLALASACAPANPTPDAEAPTDASADSGAMSDAAPRDTGAQDGGAPSGDVSVPDVAETPLPDFSLSDLNPMSASAGMNVSLNGQRGAISAWYFATSSCHFCVSMVSELARLQSELRAANPTREVRIFVIADLDSDGATSVFSAGNSLPVLQDNRTANVQSNWMAAIRDVVVVDDLGTRKLVYNLTTRALTETVYYDDLKSRLLALANR
jgi:thiol-disulfide isomerase/thioredoxin